MKIVLIDMGWFVHVALMTTTIINGRPTLISNTLRNGTVCEELWEEVVGSRPYDVITVPVERSVESILSSAREAIGKVKYGVLFYNCEHFVNEVLTGVKSSSQVRKFAWLGAFAIGGVLLLKRKG